MVLGGEAFERWLKISALIKKVQESSLTPPTKWGHREKYAVCHLQERPHPTMLTPSLQNCEKEISVVCRPPSLWCSLTAASTDYNGDFLKTLNWKLPKTLYTLPHSLKSCHIFTVAETTISKLHHLNPTLRSQVYFSLWYPLYNPLWVNPLYNPQVM